MRSRHVDFAGGDDSGKPSLASVGGFSYWVREIAKTDKSPFLATPTPWGFGSTVVAIPTNVPLNPSLPAACLKFLAAVVVSWMQFKR